MVLERAGEEQSWQVQVPVTAPCAPLGSGQPPGHPRRNGPMSLSPESRQCRVERTLHAVGTGRDLWDKVDAPCKHSRPKLHLRTKSAAIKCHFGLHRVIELSVYCP